jgi:hypothetical protein
MPSQRDAISRLFQDDDPETIVLLKKQLVLSGDDSLPDIRVLANADSAIVASHAREVLHAISGKKAALDLEILCKRDLIPLEEACLLVSFALTPWIDIGESLRKLDAWGDQLLERYSTGSGDRVEVLTGYIHGDLGFSGNVENYYNHRNSILPCVMEDRCGLPLTLTLLTMFIAGRAGIAVHGVNLPGHFIARVGETYFDPFHKGRILSLEDCGEILSRQNIRPSDIHFEVPDTRDIMARMFSNLAHSYDVEGDASRKRIVDRWLSLVTGSDS